MRSRQRLLLAAVCAALAFGAYIATRPAPVPVEPIKPIVWDVDPDAIRAVTITLPRDNLSQSWELRDNGGWYFVPGGEPVSRERWGLAIPLLLSGPEAGRIIGEDVADSDLRIYGLDRPRLRIELAVSEGGPIVADIGDSAPDGSEDYVRTADSSAVYTVHRTFGEVVERLVREPPF